MAGFKSFLLVLFLIPVAVRGTDDVSLASGAVTNTFVVSQEVVKPRWKRTAVMATADNRPLDPTGQLASYSDAAAIGVIAARAGEIGDAACHAMTNSIFALVAVTNRIPASAQHLAISIPGLGNRNLQAEVIEEGFTGSNDWQIVRFNQLLSVPPARTITYTYPGGKASVECLWDIPWSATSMVHRCTFPRPPFPDGSFVIRSKRSDIFGGEKGFSFGNSLVKIDGDFAYTGSVTNSVTHQVLMFENGVLKQTEN